MARIIPIIKLDKSVTKGMTKEEKRAYYIHKFRMDEVARLEAERS